MLQFHGSETYIASDELIRSVNIAAALKKPLLIKGEPGTGKTMLAEAIAQSLGMDLLICSGAETMTPLVSGVSSMSFR